MMKTTEHRHNFLHIQHAELKEEYGYRCICPLLVNGILAYFCDNLLHIINYNEKVNDPSCLSKNQRTIGPVNAHLICWPSKAQDIQNMENIW